jgi:transposase
MDTLSLDLRTRILATYDEGRSTREEVARRYRVSLGMVKKLLQQRRRTGDLAPRHRFSGRKPKLRSAQRRQLRALVRERPDRTLAELRAAAGLDCTLPAIHYVLRAMGLSYKKRRSGPANKTAPTSKKPAGRGAGARAASTRRGWSSSTKAGPRPT